MGVSSCEPSLSACDVDAVFESFGQGLCDYTVDSRGDIGAVVREAAMTGILTVLSLIATSNLQLLSPQM